MTTIKKKRKMYHLTDTNYQKLRAYSEKYGLSLSGALNTIVTKTKTK